MSRGASEQEMAERCNTLLFRACLLKCTGWSAIFMCARSEAMNHLILDQHRIT